MRTLAIATMCTTLALGYGCGEQRDVALDESGTTSGDALLTDFTSEEFPPAFCAPGHLARAIQCTGDFCDNVQMDCDQNLSSVNSTDTVWTDWVEADGRRSTTCLNGYWVDGIECRGGNCDDVRFRCARAGSFQHKGCFWTDWYSEESGWYVAPEGNWLAGVRCEGRHCDNKRYYVCSADRPTSCAGRCGEAYDPANVCHCDLACTPAGDCCGDYPTFCGP
ncbi:MAG: hypothetical protein AAFP04_16605 [Myxococcota bacterium]